MSELPSAEQQAATAAKYSKPVPFPIDDLRPPVVQAVVEPEEELAWYWTLAILATLFCIVAFVGGLTWNILMHNVFTHHQSFFSSGWGAVRTGSAIWIGALAFLILFWFFFLFIGFFVMWFKLGWGLTQNAMKPCPTPAEIEQKLRARGYNPSVADVMAVHTAAKREQYENVALAGAWFVANHILGDHMSAAGRAARGSKPG
jgi:hypothetical protein